MNLKVASIVLAVLAAMILLTGTFGFTSVTADRGLQVSVADNDHAKVGIEKLGGEASAGDEIKLLNITNKWTDGMTISDVSVEPLDGVEVTDEELSVGDGARISAQCSLDAGTTEEIDVTFTASVDGAQTTITRTVEVTCTKEQLTSEEELKKADLRVEFKGEGNAVITWNTSQLKTLEIARSDGGHLDEDSKSTISGGKASTQGKFNTGGNTGSELFINGVKINSESYFAK